MKPAPEPERLRRQVLQRRLLALSTRLVALTRYDRDGVCAAGPEMEMVEKPELTLLIDGACPLCRREGAHLRRLDRGRGRLRIEDISAPDFDPARYGLTHAQVQHSIHGILPDGEIIKGMAVFRRAYGLVGRGWLVKPTGWRGLKRVFDALYDWFARNRKRLTGRQKECVDGACSAHREG